MITCIPVKAKHSSFQYLHSYILVRVIFSTKYCGFVPLTEWASFTVRFAIFVVDLNHRDDLQPFYHCHPDARLAGNVGRNSWSKALKHQKLKKWFPVVLVRIQLNGRVRAKRRTEDTATSNVTSKNVLFLWCLIVFPISYLLDFLSGAISSG